jgi:ankyrin repeat protein
MLMLTHQMEQSRKYVTNVCLGIFDDNDIKKFTNALKTVGSEWLTSMVGSYTKIHPLVTACRWARVQVVQALLAVPDININKASAKGATPFSAACGNGRGDVVRLLLARKDIQLNQINLHAALSAACSHGSADVVQLLLAIKDIQVNADEDGWTALIRACMEGHVDVVRLLLARKEIQINQAGVKGRTPLYFACGRGQVFVVQLLLARKEIQINQAAEDGTTPLSTVCGKGPFSVSTSVKIVSLLLARKEIQINQADEHGLTPLFVACSDDNMDVLRLLLARKEIQINQARDDGGTPLWVACFNGYLRIVNALLNFDPRGDDKYDAESLRQRQPVDINKGPDNLTPLDVAIISAESAATRSNRAQRERRSFRGWAGSVPLSERWDIVVRLEDIPSVKTNKPAVYKDDEGYIRARNKANVLQQMRKEIADNIASKSKTPGAGDLATILGRSGHFLPKPVESSGTYMQFVKKK